MTTTTLSFIHRFEPATGPGRPPLLLLHGTGGDENDLLPLGRALAPGAALLSPRGKVLENGMPRFFRRLAEGVFDEDDVRRRADELADFVAEAREPTAWRHRSRSASRTAPTSRPPCCCCGRRRWPAPSCCGRWCRSRDAAGRRSRRASRSCILSGAIGPDRAGRERRAGSRPC